VPALSFFEENRSLVCQALQVAFRSSYCCHARQDEGSDLWDSDYAHRNDNIVAHVPILEVAERIPVIFKGRLGELVFVDGNRLVTNGLRTREDNRRHGPNFLANCTSRSWLAPLVVAGIVTALPIFPDRFSGC
jgi:hypothetical protein